MKTLLAAGISDVSTVLGEHVASIAALSAVGLAITGAYLVIHHTKKAANAAGGGMSEADYRGYRMAETADAIAHGEEVGYPTEEGDV